MDGSGKLNSGSHQDWGFGQGWTKHGILVSILSLHILEKKCLINLFSNPTLAQLY